MLRKEGTEIEEGYELMLNGLVREEVSETEVKRN